MAGLRFQTFRAFRQRNFRLFFVGQVLSVSGTWGATESHQAWLRSVPPDSFFVVSRGIVTFAASAPAFLLTLIAGLIADRVDRRRMLVWAQSFAMLQAVALAAATLSGAITANWLLVLSLVLGLVNAVENPTRQSFYSEMVEPEDLSNAIALNASLVNAARVIGPAIAGGLVALWGEGICFAINAASFLAVIVALLMMKVKPVPREAGRGKSWKMLREGFAFVRGTPMLAAMLLNFGIFNLAGSPYQTLLPVLAAERLLSGPAGLGWLVSASGIGADSQLSLVLASRPSTRGLPAGIVHCLGARGSGADRPGLLAQFRTVAMHDADYRRGLFDHSGSHPNHDADVGPRSHARQSDGLLFPCFSRSAADWRPGRGNRRRAISRQCYGCDWRAALRVGRILLCAQRDEISARSGRHRGRRI